MSAPKLQPKSPRFTPRQLTKHLRELVSQPHTADDDGSIITKGEALARLLWNKALGYIKSDPKTDEKVYNKPESWAIQLIFERLEGKTPSDPMDDIHRPSMAERVSEIAVKQFNAEAAAAVEATKPTKNE